jgi:hypothetical protein
MHFSFVSTAISFKFFNITSFLFTSLTFINFSNQNKINIIKKLKTTVKKILPSFFDISKQIIYEKSNKTKNTTTKKNTIQKNIEWQKIAIEWQKTPKQNITKYLKNQQTHTKKQTNYKSIMKTKFFCSYFLKSRWIYIYTDIH